MIDFFHSGSQVGFTISGVGGVILISYIMLESLMLILTRTFLWRKLLIAFNVYRQLKVAIPRWWVINKISIITITKKKNNLQVSTEDFVTHYECYVLVSSKYSDGIWTNDYIKTNSWGKIIKCDIFDGIKTIDYRHQDKVKQYNRDSLLEEIGIN